MIKNFCVIVNTNSSYSDLWEMFFKSLETFFPDQKVYVFSDIFTNIDNKYIHVKYDPNDDFRTQFFKSMQSVKEEFCLTIVSIVCLEIPEKFEVIVFPFLANPIMRITGSTS